MNSSQSPQLNPIPLFSPRGLDDLRTFLAHRPLLVFDFDGTLAPIVNDPAAAAMAPEVARLVDALAQRTFVAVVSGRARNDVVGRLPESVKVVIGNHGLEGFCNPNSHEQAAMRSRLDDWAMQISDIIKNIEGVSLEDKGVSLAIHYRAAADPAGVETWLNGQLERMSPRPRLIGGKCVINLLPSEKLDKGSAVVRLMNEMGRDFALFIGDDVTDEDVFLLRDPRIFGINIGLLPTAAAYTVERQVEILALLERVLPSF